MEQLTKTKLSLLPKKLFRIRMSRNFGTKMLTMTNLSTECLIQLTKLGYDATPFNQILKQNAKREMRLDRKSGSAGMPRPISYAVFCLKKKTSMIHAVHYNVTLLHICHDLFVRHSARRDLQSFPTRRSSDLESE